MIFRIVTLEDQEYVYKAHTSVTAGPQDEVHIGYTRGASLIRILSLKDGTYTDVNHSHVILDHAVAFGPTGNPWVAYEFNADLNGVNIAEQVGGQWQVVFGSSSGKINPKMKVDGDGYAHLVYEHFYTTGNDDPGLYIASNSGGSWDQLPVHPAISNHNPSFPSIALRPLHDLDLSPAGEPRIVYRGFQDRVVYAWPGDAFWYSTQISIGDDAEYLAMDVTPTNNAHVCYRDDNTNSLIHAERLGGWPVTTVDDFADVGHFSAIAVDSYGDPHIAHRNETNNSLRYTWRENGVWYSMTVDASADVGRYCSIDIDDYDTVHIAYRDNTNDALKYAYFKDCDDNGVHDDEEIESDPSKDCNGNGLLDQCEIDLGYADDCNGNGVPDDCEEDCNNNGVPDDCDIDDGTSEDCNSNGIPDDCEIDCNDNGIPDDCDIEAGTSEDCNRNDIPDECDFASGTSQDCNDNDIPDECDITYGGLPDCDSNGVPDECDFASGDPVDCNDNQEIDLCELPDAWHVGGSAYGWFGWAVASGDFDGDGFTDIAVGQPTYSNEGRVNIFYGGDPMDTDVDEVMTWSHSGSLYGRSLATGNINGDSYDDLLIGIPGYSDGVGAVIVYVGTAEADLTYLDSRGGYQYNSNFGESVALADVTDDGLDDIIVGAPAQVTNQDPGHVYVYDATNLGANPIETWDGYENDDDFGSSVANAGDVDGNGLDDVLVGTSFFGNYDPDFVGYARLFLSQPGGMVEGPALGTGEAGDLYGYAVSSAGDINDDGYDDFVVTAPYSGVSGNRPGLAFLYFGGETPDGVPDLVFVGSQHLADLGSAVAPAGDVNADGFPDLIIGSDHLHNGGEYSWADLFFGGPHLDAEPDQRIFSDDNGFGMGFSVAPGGDTNGDEILEVLVGHPQHSSAEFFEGRVSIVQLDLPDFGDCNLNGITDMCDISNGTSQDVNGNGIPDECEVIPDGPPIVITDDTSGTSIVDGTVNIDEYVGFSVGINSGFGDVIGTDSQIHVDSDESGALNWGLITGGGDLSDHMVIYIDSRPGGFGETSSFMDIADPLRAAISATGFLDIDGRADITFPTGFDADFAIGMEAAFVGLWELVDPSNHSFIAGAPPTTATLHHWEFDFTMENLGLEPGDSFDYIVTYGNAVNGSGFYRSDEFHGVMGTTVPSGNIGINPVILAPGDLNTFHSYDPGTDVADETAPHATRMLGAYPNPFNPRTDLVFELAEPTAVSLTIYDLSGRQIKTLADGEWFSSGRHSVTWQGRDKAGKPAAAGVYFYRFRALEHENTGRLTLIK